MIHKIRFENWFKNIQGKKIKSLASKLFCVSFYILNNLKFKLQGRLSYKTKKIKINIKDLLKD